MILRLNFGLESAVSTYGEPPALLTTTSSRAVPLDDRVDQRLDRLLVANIAGMEFIGQALDGAPCAGHHGRALLGENRTDTGTYPANAAGDQNHPTGQSEIDGLPRKGACFGSSHCASVPSKCLLR